jgi:cytochrome c5
MRTLLAVALGMAFVSPGALGASAAVPVSQAASDPATRAHRAVLDRYCVTCHNVRLQTGGLALDAADLARRRSSARCISDPHRW